MGREAPTKRSDRLECGFFAWLESWLSLPLRRQSKVIHFATHRCQWAGRQYPVFGLPQPKRINQKVLIKGLMRLVLSSILLYSFLV